MFSHKNAKKAYMNHCTILIWRSFMMLFCIMIIGVNSFAQGSAGSKATMPRMNIVDMPTARILPKGAYRINGLIMQSSGILGSVSFGIANNINLGFSYSSVPFLGDGTPEVQKFPVFEVKARVITETKGLPAIALGLNTQGLGGWTTDERYRFNAPGAYITASKNLTWNAGKLSIHGGVSYAIMPSPYKQSPIAFAGVEQSLYRNVTLSAEYVGTWNEDPAYSNQNGLLNCAVKYSPYKGITLHLQLRDILESRTSADGLLRYAGLEYIGVL